MGFPFVFTLNSVVPLPLRPLSSVTWMSKSAGLAVPDTSMVVTSSLELVNFTLRTVMPPGFVVPETKYCAFADGSNPLPVTTTSSVSPW